jgi:DNA-directed RNA polymerase subunit RPC12/RpoP
MIDFLLGVGIGFIEDEYIDCTQCGCQFLPEELRYVDGEYVCPVCLRQLDDEEAEEDDEE